MSWQWLAFIMPLKKCSLFVFLVLQHIPDQRVSGFCEMGLPTVCRVVLSHSSALHNLAAFHVCSLDPLKQCWLRCIRYIFHVFTACHTPALHNGINVHWWSWVYYHWLLGILCGATGFVLLVKARMYMCELWAELCLMQSLQFTYNVPTMALTGLLMALWVLQFL